MPADRHRSAVPRQAEFVYADLRDREQLAGALGDHLDGVPHFAVLALVGESVEHPERYWHTTWSARSPVGGDARAPRRSPRVLLHLRRLRAARPGADPGGLSGAPTNAYGASKLAVDEMISSFCTAHGLGAVSLRYFIVAGASEELGEDQDPETHLIPNILRGALGRTAHVQVFGTDYYTPDARLHAVPATRLTSWPPRIRSTASRDGARASPS